MKKLDYGKLATEQSNPRSARIDCASVEQILAILNREDRSVPAAVGRARPQIARGVRLIVASLQSGGRLFFAGAGTSGRLGVLEAAECPPTFNTPPSLIQAFMAGGKSAVFQSKEGAEDRRDEGARMIRLKARKADVVVGIAASGVTPFVGGALAAARALKAKTILITCADARLFRHLADCIIAVRVGPEVISGSTRLKAGTATKLVLNMLTVTSMVRLGKVYRNWMVDLQPKSLKLRARALRLVTRLGEVPEKDAAHYLKQARGHAKLAILMARRKWNFRTAERKLTQAAGFLEKALR